MEQHKVALYSEICQVFMFNEGSFSFKTSYPIDTKVGMGSPFAYLIKWNCLQISATRACIKASEPPWAQ